jgi:putative heme-binding domain-containing protein
MRNALVSLVAALAFIASAEAQDPSVAPLMRLLQSGRLPKERQPQVLEMVARRGGPDELRFVFEQTLDPEALSPELRLQSLQWLAEAANTRKAHPSGDLAGIVELMRVEPDAKNVELPLAAMRLASAWRVEAAVRHMAALAADRNTPDRLRRAAVEGLGSVGGDESRRVFAALARPEEPARIRILATASLVRIDADAAAKAAAEVLAAATASDDPDPMLAEFFLLREGSTKLTAALRDVELKPDVAKRALRYMYSVGHDDAELSALLSELSGIAADMPPPTQEEALKIAAEVVAKGDAARGEQIFRRAEVSCLNCHAIHRAGGQVGPDLSNVGRISPVDYIVTSILDPNLAIKEAFVTRIIETDDGRVAQGIVVDRDDVRVILRTADGKTLTIPTADIEAEEEGRSLMPQGLTKFLTHEEFLDLAKFVSELGKEESGYTAPSPPAIQRWRVLAEPHEELLSGVPNVEQVRLYLLDAPSEQWRSAYATTSGHLPLAELAGMEEPQPLYLMGEVDVSAAGDAILKIESTEPVQAWLNALPLAEEKQSTVRLEEGRQRLIVRIEAPRTEQPRLRTSVSKPAGSTAQFDIVAGQ